MAEEWKKTASQTLSATRSFTLRRDTVVNPRNEKEMEAFVIECPDWVNVVALTKDEEIILVRQFRHGVGKSSLEIPGGTVDVGEDPREAAARELLEETGYAPERLLHLGTLDAQPAMQSNRLHTYLALGCEVKAPPDPDDGEDIKVELRPAASVGALVLSGEITHSMMLTAFYWWSLRKES
ncbi:NUDIX hydrolase [bacterium]|nr:MAG: NUDIX hydrolase [bacterium]